MIGEITEKDGKEAFVLHKKILSIKNRIGILFVELGKMLKEMRDNSLYRALNYDSFRSYVVNSSLGFTRRTAYYYIEIYECFVEKLGYDKGKVAEIGYKNLVKLLPRVKESENKEKVEELVTDVQELRPVDFKKKYKDKEKQEPEDDYLAPPEYFMCDKCGKWFIIVPIDDCCEKWMKKTYERLKKIYG